MFLKYKKVFLGTLSVVFIFFLHLLYQNATASNLYFWRLEPESGGDPVYPGLFRIYFDRPVALNVDPIGVVLRSLSGPESSNVAIPNHALSVSGNTFSININEPTLVLPVAGGLYRIIIQDTDLYDGDSSNYYNASGYYWSGFPLFCEGCWPNEWVVTFANPFTTPVSSPESNTTLDFASFATTVRTNHHMGVVAGTGNAIGSVWGVSDVVLAGCADNALIGSLNTDRPTSVSGSEALLTIPQERVRALLGNYDASVSGADRCVRIHLPSGYVKHPSYNLGSPTAHFTYTLRYLAHERFGQNNAVVQPNQIFSIDFNQQIELSATTTAARLYDVEAQTYVASIPMVTGANAYVGDGEVDDGMDDDTLYLDFASVYALEPGKEYGIQIPGIAVRKLNSWDYVRYDIEESEYSFTVANDADAPKVNAHIPSGIDVSIDTTEFVLVFDEPITLSSDTTTFDVWTLNAATATVSSVGNVYESVSGDEYSVDLRAIVQEAFGVSVLAENTTYWIRVSSNAVVDDEGNSMDAPYIFNFKTTAPAVDPVIDQVDDLEIVSRGSSGRRARSGGVSAGVSNGPSGQSGIIPADSVGQLTEPIYEDLTFGDRGDAVYYLQQALNRIGFYVAEDGPGSPGQETRLFGTSTRNAVIRFQRNAGIVPAAGYFGPITRTLLGFILNW